MLKKNKIQFVVPVIYFILCIIISFQRIPFWDEARAWLISQNCNVFEFLDLMKLECHFFIWYLIIFPFAKLNLFYPYSIYVLNALFAALSIFVLWKRAPFSNLEKFLITFGVPFLWLWGVVARCYSIGILFLFLALSLYKIRSKKPYCYLTFLSLAMNTSVMAYIGAFFLFVLFLFENVKNKNALKYFLIFLFTNLIILIQIYSPSPKYLAQAPEMLFLRDFLGFVLCPLFLIKEYLFQSVLMSFLRTSSLICAVLFLIFAIKNNKKVLFFVVASYSSLIILFTFFYSGNFWHYFYFYLYFIFAFWILKLENKIPKVLNIVFILILALFMFRGSLFIDSKLTTINNSTSKYIASEILNNPKYDNAKLFCLDPWSDIAPSSLPYLKNKREIYDIFNNSRFSYESMINHIRFNKEFFNPDEFYKFVDDNSILLTTTALRATKKKTL